MARRRHQPHSSVGAHPAAGLAVVALDSDGGVGKVSTDVRQVRHFSSVVAGMAWDPYAQLSAGRQNQTIRGLKGLTTGLREILLPEPHDRDGIIARIHSYARDIWLVKVWAQRLADFGSAGFEMFCDNETVAEFTKSLAKSLNWDAVDYRLHRTLALNEQAVLWWMYYGPGETRAPDAPSKGLYVPKWIEQIAPSAITFSKSEAEPILRADRIEPLASIMKKKASARTIQENRYLAAWPEDLRVAASKGGSSAYYPMRLLLSPQNITRMGFQVINHWNKDDWQKWPVPSLYSVLADFEYILLCEDLDFAAIHRMRAGIVLWRMGPKDPSPTNPGPPETVLKKAEARIKQSLASLAPDIFVGNDFSVEWVVPPKEFFDPAKYNSALRRIMDLLGVPQVFYAAGDSTESGRSTAYAASYIAVKPFQQAIVARRRMIKREIERWFWMMVYVNHIGPAKKPTSITVQYDSNVLVEDANVLRKLQLGVTQGIISNRTVADAMGLDWDAEIAQRRRELQLAETEPLLIRPYFSQSRGGSPSTDVGRPQTSLETPNPDDNTRNKPSTAMLALDDASSAGEEFDATMEALGMGESLELESVALAAEFGDFAFAEGIEETKSWIHIPVSTKKYKSYRYSDKKTGGIRLLYGIDKDGKSEVATVLFSKPKWTLKKAKEWVTKHYEGR